MCVLLCNYLLNRKVWRFCDLLIQSCIVFHSCMPCSVMQLAFLVVHANTCLTFLLLRVSFKRLNLLKVDDIFTCQCMSFYHKYVNNNVPLFCKSLFTCNATHHEYHTRHNLQLVIPYSHTSRAKKSVRYHFPSLLRSMPQCVIEKVHTQWVLFIS